MNEAEKPVSDSVIFVDGWRGYGKSAALIHLVNHHYSLNWIVLHFPDLSQWTNGSESYSSVEGVIGYSQQDLAAKLLRFILDSNSKVFEKIAAPNGGKSMFDYITMALQNRAGGSVMEVFERVMKHLVSGEGKR